MFLCDANASSVAYCNLKMDHPIHLHGHRFWVLGTGSGNFPYSTAEAAPAFFLNLQNPPYRDSMELPSSGWAVIR